MASPSNRAESVRPLVEATGGKLLSYYVTSGETDFQMVIDTSDASDSTGILSALMVAGASGTVSNLKTVQAYSAKEFMSAQQNAGALIAKFKAAG